MDIRPINPTLGVTPATEAIHQVKPEEEAQEFGQKEQADRRQSRRRSPDINVETEAALDTVDVSEDYLAAQEQASAQTPKTVESPDESAMLAPKRIDIRA
jgi:hypothetical protein